MTKKIINIFSVCICIIALSCNINAVMYSNSSYNVTITFPEYCQLIEPHPQQLGPDQRVLLEIATCERQPLTNVAQKSSNHSEIATESERLYGNFYLTYAQDAMSSEIWDGNKMTNVQQEELFLQLHEALKIDAGTSNIVSEKALKAGGKRFVTIEYFIMDENGVNHRAIAQETIINGAYFNLIFISEDDSAFTVSQKADLEATAKSILPITAIDNSAGGNGITENIKPDNLYIVFIALFLSVAFLTLFLFFYSNYKNNRKNNNPESSINSNLEDNDAKEPPPRDDEDIGNDT